MRWRLAPAVLTPVLALACGGAAPPPSGPGPSGPAPDQPTGGPLEAASAEPAPDLSPAAQPEFLFLAGRIQDPAAAVSALGRWAAMPLDLRRIIERKAPELRDLLLLDAPVEVMAALNPVAEGTRPGKPFVVVSVPVKSVAAVVAADPGAWKSVGPGVYRDEDCAVAPALGRAPARVVCEATEGGLAVLLPWATRGQPAQALSQAPVHLELRGEPLRRLYGQQVQQARSLVVPLALSRLSLDDPRADRLIGDAVHAVADELLALIEDFDRVEVDLDIPAGGEHVGLRARAAFTKDAAWTLRVLGNAQARGSGPPDTFWQLPAEAVTATWHRSAEPQLTAGLRDSASRAVDIGLGKLELPGSVRAHLTALVEAFLTGRDTACAAGGATAVGKPPRKAAELSGWVAGALGWRVCSVAGDAKLAKQPFELLARLLKDPALARELEKRFEVKKAHLPTLKSAPTPGFKGATTWRLSVPAALFGEPGETARIEVVAVVAPGHGVTWVAFGGVERELIERLRGMQAGAPNLGSRADLASLRQRRGFTGGFTSLAAMNDPLSRALSEAADEPGIPRVDVETLPDKGRTPILLDVVVEREAGVALTLDLVVPQAAASAFSAGIPTGGLGI